MKSKKKKKQTKRSNFRLLLLTGIAGMIMYSYLHKGSSPIKERRTHRVLLFVDAPLVGDVRGENYKELQRGLREWLIPQLDPEEPEILTEKELHIFSLNSYTGCRPVMSFQIVGDDLAKMKGRGFRTEKTEQFKRKYRKAFRQLAQAASVKYCHVFQSLFNIKNYLRYHKMGDRTSIVYYSDLMQRDVDKKYNQAQYNFTLLNPESNGLYTIDEAGLESAQDHLRDSTSSLYRKYIDQVNRTFLEKSHEELELILIESETEYNPGYNQGLNKEDVRQFWQSFFASIGLVKEYAPPQFYPLKGPWEKALLQNPEI